MSGAADSFEADRAAREEALAQLRSHAESLKQGLEERPVKQRLADDVAVKARGVADEAAAIAGESKPIIAGTLGLLALWFLRRPLEKSARKVWPAVAARFSRKTET
jgi:hypothetical protein